MLEAKVRALECHLTLSKKNLELTNDKLKYNIYSNEDWIVKMKEHIEEYQNNIEKTIDNIQSTEKNLEKEKNGTASSFSAPFAAPMSTSAPAPAPTPAPAPAGDNDTIASANTHIRQRKKKDPPSSIVLPL